MEDVIVGEDAHPLLEEFMRRATFSSTMQRRRDLSLLLGENHIEMAEEESYVMVIGIILNHLNMSKAELQNLTACCGVALSTFERHAHAKNIPCEVVRIQLICMLAPYLRRNLCH